MNDSDTHQDRRECRTCDGDGLVHRRHESWGKHDCPEDYVEEDCPACGGAGHTLTYPPSPIR